MVDTFAVVLATGSYILAQEFQPREQWKEEEKRKYLSSFELYDTIV